MDLTGKCIVLAVTGGIAAYKIAGLASTLKKTGADVIVTMTENATQFISPVTFETLTGNKCLIDTFDRNFQYSVEHVAIAKRADVVLVAPATANVIAKAAHGIADDMLTTTLLACPCHKIIAPAMNTNMYRNPIVQDNLKTLAGYGFEVIAPDCGYLACGDIGDGKLPSEAVLLSYIEKAIACEKTLAGKKVLITAGATRERIDPVRFITNHSTGKMGYALAKMAMLRGAQVTLVTGASALTPPPFVKVVQVESAAEMFAAATEHAQEQDIFVMAAAVADYRPAVTAQEKIKKSDGEMSIPLTRTQDILAHLGAHKREGQFVCGFSMETENMLENSQKKLLKKNADMICANSLRQEGAGFGTDTNILTLITADGALELPCMSKEEAADRIFAKILERMGE
ncbi:MAG: bifunctional phosphopantothenoylcysteine decarboxylase/phosphopantothenate--cysteine ligase CoaBC [Ruminococcus sp.]|nr:bifunctional phosphopantothenoylcysteine decarboxylase/phosphopantothenate--cysteine ligase CoaBC [Ruminococcus sp.]